MRTQINVKLDENDLNAIDAGVALRNERQEAGRPGWTRTSYIVVAALAQAAGEAASEPGS